MAVVYKGKHHRNPSGCNNKAKWILSKVEWNKTAAIKLVERITAEMPEGKQRTSWYIALGIALAMYDDARHRDMIVANVINQYINRHINVLSHYILDCATSLRDYIKQVAASDIINQQKVE